MVNFKYFYAILSFLFGCPSLPPETRRTDKIGEKLIVNISKPFSLFCINTQLGLPVQRSKSQAIEPSGFGLGRPRSQRKPYISINRSRREKSIEPPSTASAAMASTSNGDKKRKKEKKNKNLQERPENDEFEDIKKKKNKKKQRLQPLAEPAAAAAAAKEVEDKVMEKHGKKQNKKKDKTKVKKERNRQDGREPESAGDIVEEKKKRNSRITDPRFSSAHFDPRFQRMPKRESKVVIDSRFTRMFSDKNFSTSSAPVDKRGKARKEKGVNPLLHYYLHREAEGDEETEMKEEETDELREGSPELPRKASSSESELEVSEEDFAASESDESTSTSEEEDDEDDEYSVGSDICQYLMADHKDTPMTDKVTYRLAVVNMDWDHIKAVDLYVVMSSCLPKGGQVLSVAVYPSEFGLKCMEIEAVHGPSGLLDGNEEHSDDDSDIYNEKLRTYELNKLR